jgi:hypothetical protein
MSHSQNCILIDSVTRLRLLPKLNTDKSVTFIRHLTKCLDRAVTTPLLLLLLLLLPLHGAVRLTD